MYYLYYTLLQPSEITFIRFTRSRRDKYSTMYHISLGASRRTDSCSVYYHTCTVCVTVLKLQKGLLAPRPVRETKKGRGSRNENSSRVKQSAGIVGMAWYSPGRPSGIELNADLSTATTATATTKILDTIQIYINRSSHNKELVYLKKLTILPLTLFSRHPTCIYINHIVCAFFTS